MKKPKRQKPTPLPMRPNGWSSWICNRVNRRLHASILRLNRLRLNLSLRRLRRPRQAFHRRCRPSGIRNLAIMAAHSRPRLLHRHQRLHRNPNPSPLKRLRRHRLLRRRQLRRLHPCQ
jgi:hypothetical protein